MFPFIAHVTQQKLFLGPRLQLSAKNVKATEIAICVETSNLSRVLRLQNLVIAGVQLVFPMIVTYGQATGIRSPWLLENRRISSRVTRTHHYVCG